MGRAEGPRPDYGAAETAASMPPALVMRLALTEVI